MFFSIIPEGVPCSTQTSDLSQIIGVICAVNNDAFRALQKRHTAQEVPTVLLVRVPLLGWDKFAEITRRRT
jgi:hypothetical protein